MHVVTRAVHVSGKALGRLCSHADAGSECSMSKHVAGACLVQELFVGDPAVLIEVIALPVESHPVAMPSLDMPVQAIVCEICLGTHKPLNLHWPLAHIKIEPAAVMKL